MKNLKTLSLCVLLNLGILNHVAHAEKLHDTIIYPEWLKTNLFNFDNPRNQYVGSASIVSERSDFYSSYIPYNEKLSAEQNAEKIAFLRAKLNAYNALESILVARKMRKRIYEALNAKTENVNDLFKIVDFLVSQSIVAKRFVDKTNHRVYIMVQFPLIQPEELIAYWQKRNSKLSNENAKNLSTILNKTLFDI
ncbi:hypothetical protein [Helicobacter cetorum]|uniref:hypothetical protein n=1 Tax=Helicobacter cetorum TaxID=138563 RepID=UPI000CF0355A|nr:hypothetical protein [Helicobacter cetorum]